MKVLVCGGRDFSDVATINRELNAFHAQIPITELIHGAARGADSLAAAWAKSKGIPLRAFPSDWNKHGKGAGYRRNEEMLRQGKPDIVIAFPGGRGTADMVSRAADAGLRVIPIPEITVARRQDQC